MRLINYLKIGGIFSDFWGSMFGEGDADPETILKILQDYSNYIQYQNVFLMWWESITWGVIKGLYWLNSSLESTIHKSFDLSSILHAAGIDELYVGLISKVVAILCVLTLMYLGLKFAVSKTPPKPKNILVNLILSMILIFGSSTMIDEGLNLTKSFFGDVTNSEKASGHEAPSFQLIKDNVYDVTTVLGTDAKNLDKLPSKKRNGLTSKNFKVADINSVLVPDQIKETISKSEVDESTKEKMEALNYRLILDESGKETPIEISDSWLGEQFYASGYRRYTSFNGSIVMGEGSLTAAYLFILFTLVTCIIELGYKKFYLVIAASTDLEHGQRTKTAVIDLTNCLLLIAFTILEMKIYTSMLTGLSDLKAAGTINTMIYIVGLVCLTIALFKGSQAVTKIFGVDTSLPNSGGGLLSTLGAVSLGKSAIKGTASTVKGGASSLNNIRKKAFGKSSEQEEGTSEGLGGLGKGEESATGSNKQTPKEKKPISEAFAKAAGYTKERGVGQSVADVASDAKDTVKDKASEVVENIKENNPVKKAVDATKDKVSSVKDAYGEGKSSALDKSSVADISTTETEVGQPNVPIKSNVDTMESVGKNDLDKPGMPNKSVINDVDSPGKTDLNQTNTATSSDINIPNMPGQSGSDKPSVPNGVTSGESKVSSQPGIDPDGKKIPLPSMENQKSSTIESEARDQTSIPTVQNTTSSSNGLNEKKAAVSSMGTSSQKEAVSNVKVKDDATVKNTVNEEISSTLNHSTQTNQSSTSSVETESAVTTVPIKRETVSSTSGFKPNFQPNTSLSSSKETKEKNDLLKKELMKNIKKK